MFLGPKGARTVPTANRNGQLPSPPSVTTEINKESSSPAVPVRKTSSPASLGNEITKPEAVKAVVPPPVMARKHTAPVLLLDSQVVNTNSVPEDNSNDDDEPPPPLPVKKGNSNLNNEIISPPMDTSVVPDQSTGEIESTSELTSPEGTPPPSLPTKIAEEVNVTEGIEGELESEDNDEGSPPPLPVKVAEMPPPPPPEEESDGSPPPMLPSEEDDSDGSPPPLPVKKELTPPLTVVTPPPATQGDQVAAIEENDDDDDDDDDDEPPPPLPVKKLAQPEAPLPSTVVPVVSPPVEVPVNLPSENSIDAGSGSTLVPEVVSSKRTNVPPPVPQRRTPVLKSHVDRSKDEGVTNPPPLPNKTMTVPPPPPPDSSSDTESEDDNRTQQPLLVSLKSQSVQDDDIPLSVPKKYDDETTDSSDDEECSIGVKIISQPSADDDTIAISSKPICDSSIAEEDEMNMGISLHSNGTNDEGLDDTAKLPPPYPMPRRVSSPPLLSPPHNTLSKSASCDAISDVSSVYSELGPAPPSIYSQLGPTSMYSELGPALNNMYGQVGPAPPTVPAQVNDLP